MSSVTISSTNFTTIINNDKIIQKRRSISPSKNWTESTIYGNKNRKSLFRGANSMVLPPIVSMSAPTPPPKSEPAFDYRSKIDRDIMEKSDRALIHVEPNICITPPMTNQKVNLELCTPRKFGSLKPIPEEAISSLILPENIGNESITSFLNQKDRDNQKIEAKFKEEKNIFSTLIKTRNIQKFQKAVKRLIIIIKFHSVIKDIHFGKTTKRTATYPSLVISSYIYYIYR